MCKHDPYPITSDHYLCNTAAYKFPFSGIKNNNTHLSKLMWEKFSSPIGELYCDPQEVGSWKAH